MLSPPDKSLLQAPISEFEHWWRVQGEWVEPANQRRGGESGVQLLDRPVPLYCKRQQGHIYRTLSHPFGRPTVARECHAYRAIGHLGINTPRLIYAGVRRHQGQWQGLLVTEALLGFISLADWYAQPQPAALTRAMLSQLATTLARLHRARWQHGCCYPKHIFIRVTDQQSNTPAVEIALLDLEKSRRRLRTQTASGRDLSQLDRHRGNMPETDMLFILSAHQHALHHPTGTAL